MKLPWPDVKVPEYRTGSYGKWKLSTTEGCMPGYFTPNLVQMSAPALRRREHGKDIVWMSLTQMEKESHMPHIAAAKGHTVVMGLGMGMYLYNIIQKPEVTRVTVIERDPAVFKLLTQISDYNSWPGIEKVKVVIADAKAWTTAEQVDFMYADFWKNMADKNAMRYTKLALQNVRPKEFGYWTQEYDFIDHLRDSGASAMAADTEYYKDFAASFGGSRIVGLGCDMYPLLCTIAVVIQTVVAMRNDLMRAYTMQDMLKLLVMNYERKYG